jgi:hypothetical protein
MNLTHKARFWAVTAGPLLFPISAAVVVFILSSGGAYIAVHAPGNVMGEAIRISASALEHVVRETVSVFRPDGS